MEWVRRQGKDENEPRLSSWFVFGTHWLCIDVDPTHCRRVLRVVIVSYASSLGPTHCGWGSCRLVLGLTLAAVGIDSPRIHLRRYRLSSNLFQCCRTRLANVEPVLISSHPYRCRQIRIDVGYSTGVIGVIVGPYHCCCGTSGAGGGCCVGLNVVSGELEDGWEKTNHDFHRGSFAGRTGWASHLLGPPWCFFLPKSFVERD